ncbi:LysR family transcriptional regulator [Sporolactobacillus terrae]|uniref:LysR family transcriptional regulator n=1 Tax=Sporolactobacillus terrae TaxID=269673 RepID=A0A410DBV3_9BACL|nr:LysR family transcriptional regulator [Sporolactobacillus terrae]QAA23610.1 LysR family transcriptional regulator [Sporolactobacillus terrae]QAA26580.1 LysR family transcriptional regulator [Sporolactobacillus terrae]UAK15651.1 LysR family transcriptional regulator [Sporolactobacillus terrae]BBO00117.1 putative HTH-type transcriptional regulator YwqM [Sporolactobacillus terrae]
MELRQLRTFQTAAKLLNFTQAAKLLNFSQPTVTAQIRSLEEEIGHPLFFRIGKQTFLTGHGEIMKHYVDQIFPILEQMTTELQAQSRTASKLTIAASETFCTHYFPPIIRQFLADDPDIGIKLVSCTSDKVIEGINNNHFDLGIISGSYRKSGVTNIVLSEKEDLVLIVSDTLYQHNTTQDLLEKYPFIKYEIVGPFEEQMNSYIDENGIHLRKMIECSSLEAVKSAVMNDIGVGLISRNLVKKELAERQLHEIHLNQKPIVIQTSLIIAAHKLRDPKTMHFIRLIEQKWNTIH